MLKIRQEQLDAIARVMERTDDFERVLLGHLRTHFAQPLSLEDDDALLRRIREGVAVAREQGLRLRGSWGVIIDLIVVLGRDFLERDDGEWARAILADESRPEPQRIERLQLAAIEHLLARVEA